MKKNENLKVIIAGADRRAYSYDAPTKDGSWKEYLLAKISGIKRENIMFTGLLDYNDYRRLLWRSNMHCYLTKPYVTSWSLFEAAACGARLAINKCPATENIVEEKSVTWLDLNSSEQMIKRIDEEINSSNNRESKLLSRYKLKNSLIQWENLINKGLTEKHLDDND